MRQRQQGRVNQAQLQTQQLLFFLQNKSGGSQVTLCQTVVLLLLEVMLLPHCVTHHLHPLVSERTPSHRRPATVGVHTVTKLGPGSQG